MNRINLNSDMGESYGRWQLGNDTELMPYIPTINVACGFHAGDPHVMWRSRRGARRARALGHPRYRGGVAGEDDER